jgi:hypothetical protein
VSGNFRGSLGVITSNPPNRIVPYCVNGAIHMFVWRNINLINANDYENILLLNCAELHQHLIIWCNWINQCRDSETNLILNKHQINRDINYILLFIFSNEEHIHQQVSAFVEKIASKKEVDRSSIVNQLLKGEIKIAEAME